MNSGFSRLFLLAMLLLSFTTANLKAESTSQSFCESAVSKLSSPLSELELNAAMDYFIFGILTNFYLREQAHEITLTQEQERQVEDALPDIIRMLMGLGQLMDELEPLQDDIYVYRGE